MRTFSCTFIRLLFAVGLLTSGCNSLSASVGIPTPSAMNSPAAAVATLTGIVASAPASAGVLTGTPLAEQVVTATGTSSTPTVTLAPSPTTQPELSATPSPSPAAVATSTPAVTPSPISTQTPTAKPVQTPAAYTAPVVIKTYIDDRSNSVSLLDSFVSALNRREYARAYSYWEAGSQVPSFDQFQQGYADTTSVALSLGTVGGSAGAGQFYNSVPVTLIARLRNGRTQTYVGCYVTHLANPATQGQPPFQAMGIQSASVQAVKAGSDIAALMDHVCDQWAAPPLPTPNPKAPQTQLYRDDRSGPVQVLQSLFNAVNRAEYVRAYSYWEPGAEPLNYDRFARGYADTQWVKLTTGRVSSDAGAGQLYYAVPVTLAARTKRGINQLYVGCYRLHLANPAIQTEPPFQSMSIVAATVRQVARYANTALLMRRACLSD